MTQLPQCLPPYKNHAMSSTRVPTKADFEIPKINAQMELLAFEEQWIDKSARKLRKILDRLELPPTKWVCTMIFSCCHPAIRYFEMLKYHSEADVVHMTRDTFFKPAIFTLKLLNALSTLKQHNWNLTEEIIREALDEAEKISALFVSSSEPIHSDDGARLNNQQKPSAVPDMIISLLKVAEALYKDGVPERVATIEVKSPEALEAAYELFEALTISGTLTFRLTGYKWPLKSNDVKQKAAFIVCQVSIPSRTARIKKSAEILF